MTGQGHAPDDMDPTLQAIGLTGEALERALARTGKREDLVSFMRTLIGDQRVWADRCARLAIRANEHGDAAYEAAFRWMAKAATALVDRVEGNPPAATVYPAAAREDHPKQDHPKPNGEGAKS